MGAVTISADQIVHGLYARPEFVAALADRFGPDIVEGHGTVNRRRLAARVKADPESRRWLEELTHPLVKREVERVIREAPEGTVVVAEVPLLLESGFAALFDLLVTVEAAREKRVARSAERFDPDVFAEFERLQATSEQRAAASDLVFHNDGSVEHMRAFVEDAYAQARSLLGLTGSPTDTGATRAEG
jgi:dephospho-CoA kinase